MEASNIDSKKALTKLKEVFALNVILENDNEEIKKVSSIKVSLDAIVAKANATNPKDLPIIPSNIFTNHPSFSILQVPKVNIVACNDFKEEIMISQMEIDHMTFREFG